MVFGVVLAAMALRGVRGGERSQLRTVLQIAIPGPPSDKLLPDILNIATTHCQHINLRRVDQMVDEFHASLFVEFTSPQRLQDLLAAMQSAMSTASISVVERGGLE